MDGALTLDEFAGKVIGKLGYLGIIAQASEPVYYKNLYTEKIVASGKIISVDGLKILEVYKEGYEFFWRTPINDEHPAFEIVYKAQGTIIEMLLPYFEKNEIERKEAIEIKKMTQRPRAWRQKSRRRY